MEMWAFWGPDSAWTVVGCVSALLALRWWWFGPTAIICLFFGVEGPIAALSLSVLLGYFYRVFLTRSWSKRLIFLLGLLSLLGINNYENESFFVVCAVALMPWSFWLLVQHWMKLSQGIDSLWLPLWIMAFFLMLSTRETGIAGAMLFFFLGLRAWQLPCSPFQKGMTWALVIGLGVVLMWDSPHLGLLSLLALTIQIFELKWKGPAHCALKVWAWLTAVFIFGSLYFAMPNQFTFVHLGLLWALVWMGIQESCRMCIYSIDAQSSLVSLMAARSPMIYILGTVILGMNRPSWLILVIVLLMAETARFSVMKPCTNEEISSSPCQGRWLQWKQVSRG